MIHHGIDPRDPARYFIAYAIEREIDEREQEREQQKDQSGVMGGGR